MEVNVTVFACHSKACAPPPVGRGGSSKDYGQDGSSRADYRRLEKRYHQLIMRASFLAARARGNRYVNEKERARLNEKAAQVDSVINRLGEQLRSHPARERVLESRKDLPSFDGVLIDARSKLLKGLKNVIDDELPPDRSDFPILTERMDRIREAYRDELIVSEDLPKFSGSLNFTSLVYRREQWRDGTPIGVWDEYLHQARNINAQALGLRNDPEMAQKVALLDAFIARHAEPVHGSLLRGIRSNKLSDVPEMSLEVGGTFTMRQFGSWSSNAYTARRHAGVPDLFDDRDEDPHQIYKRQKRFSAVIRVVDPTGLRGVPGNLSEAETILPRNTTFKVTGVEEQKMILADGTEGIFRIIDVAPV